MDLNLTEDIGIEIECGIFLTIFRSGQKLPCRQEGLLFSTGAECQKTISICVKQGEFRKAENNAHLGQLDFNVSATSDRVSPVVKVDFFITKTGRLLVRGTHLKKNEYQYLSIELEFLSRRIFTEEEVIEDAQFSEFAILAIKARKIIKSYHQMAEHFHRNRDDRVYLSMRDDIIMAEKALAKGSYQELKDSIDGLRSNFEQITFVASSKELRHTSVIEDVSND